MSEAVRMLSRAGPTSSSGMGSGQGTKKQKAFSSPRKSASSLSLTYLPNVYQGML